MRRRKGIVRYCIKLNVIIWKSLRCRLFMCMLDRRGKVYVYVEFIGVFTVGLKRRGDDRF